MQFQEYIEMPEYQNIQTRMLGADSFPYRNVTVNEEVSIVQLFCFIISSSCCLLIILDNETVSICSRYYQIILHTKAKIYDRSFRIYYLY